MANNLVPLLVEVLAGQPSPVSRPLTRQQQARLAHVDLLAGNRGQVACMTMSGDGLTARLEEIALWAADRRLAIVADT